MISKYNKNGEFIEGIEKISDAEFVFFNINYTSDTNGDIYFAYRYLPLVKKYTPNGELLMTFEYKPSIKNKKPPMVITRTSVTRVSRNVAMGVYESNDYPVCYDIAVETSGIINLLVSADHDIEEMCMLYRFTPSGNFIEKIQLPIFCSKISIDAKSNFYFISSKRTNLIYKYFSMKS